MNTKLTSSSCHKGVEGRELHDGSDCNGASSSHKESWPAGALEAMSDRRYHDMLDTCRRECRYTPSRL